MLRLLPFLLLGGCSTISTPVSSDTLLNSSNRNWEEVYHREIDICLENNDKEGYYFFMQELIKLEFSKEGIVLPPSPILRFPKKNIDK